MFATTSIHELKGQCLSVIGGLPDSVCSGDSILLPLPANATTASWDFCTGDFAMPFSVASVSNLTSGLFSPRSLSLVNDNGTWRAFVINTSLANLFRLDFGNGIDAPPTAITQIALTGSTSLITSSTWSRLKFYNQNGVWYALGATEGNILARIAFPAVAGLASGTATLTTFTNTFGFNNVRDLEMIVKSDTIFVVAVNRVSSQLRILSFGNSILNTPTLYATHALPGFATPQSIDIKFHCGHYYAVISSESDTKIGLLQFGGSLANLQSVQQLNTAATFPLPMKVFLERENNRWVAFVKNRSTAIEFSRVFINDAFSPTPDSILQVGSISGNMIGWALDLAMDSSALYAIGVNISTNQTTYRMSFENPCAGAASDYFLSYPDTLMQLNTSGNYGVEMCFENAIGQESTVFQALVGREGVGVDVQLLEACEGDSVTLSDLSTSSVPITSRTWNIPGYGIFNDSSVTIPTTQSDTIPFTLEVTNAAGCAQLLDSSIVVHPLPNIMVALDSTCLGQELSLQNNSSIAFDSIQGWSWVFNGVDTLLLAEPSYIPLDSGTLAVQIVATSSFGCIAEESLSVYIKDAPIANLNITNTCFGDETHFQSLATSTSPFQTFWDLGDGNSETSSSFSYQYLDTGLYAVQLAVSAVNGCSDTALFPLIVADAPEILSLDIAPNRCQDQPIDVDFQIQSNAITQAFWYADGSLIDTGLVSQITFSDSGNSLLRFVVNAGTSCFDTLERSIQVNYKPLIAIQIDNQCAGQISNLTSLTASGNPNFIAAFWSYTGNDTVDSAVYDFPLEQVGNYSVWHQLRTDSGCVSDTVIGLQKVQAAQVDLNLTFNLLCTDSLLEFNPQIGLDPIDSITQAFITFSYGNGFVDTLNLLLGNQVKIFNEGPLQMGLNVESAFGCLTNDVEQVFVNRSPQLFFDTLETCVFTELDFESGYDGSNYEHFWSFGDNFTSTESAPEHVFIDEGIFEGSAFVKDISTGCFSRQALITKVYALPDLELSTDSFCAGEALNLEAVLSDTTQSIASIAWLNGADRFVDLNPLVLAALNSGVYTVEANATTNLGCSIGSNMIYRVVDAPPLDVDVIPDYSNKPYSVSVVINEGVTGLMNGIIMNGDTIFANQYELVSENQELLGLEVFAENSVGCRVSRTINVDFTNPVRDLSIVDLDFSTDLAGASQARVEVVNSGSIQIDEFELELQLLPAYRLLNSERVSLQPGEIYTVVFEGILLQEHPNVVCAEVVSVNAAVDTVSLNNEFCVPFADESILAVYPNPAMDEITVILNQIQCEEVEIQIYTSKGDAVDAGRFTRLSPTNTKKSIEISHLSKGVYIIAAQCGDFQHKLRFVKL
jgi:PKD repeat protein